MMDAGMMRTAVPIDHIFARNQKVIKQMEETYFNFYSNGAPPRPKVRLSNDVFEE